MSLLTERELSEVLKVNRYTLYVWRQAGMPYVSLGTKLVRYDLQVVLNWLSLRSVGVG